MKTLLTVGEAARAAGVTSETLRHYDRIGLVRPSRRDADTGYRYYTEQDVVRLSTVHALRQMDLPLQRIREVLEYDDLEKIIAFLAEAEAIADERIDDLNRARDRIRAARRSYGDKLHRADRAEAAMVRQFPRRVLLLSDTLERPELDTLWNYLRHFYGRLPDGLKGQFAFEDVAGVYTAHGISRLFAVCTRYADVDGLVVLPAGNYLCADCAEADRESYTAGLLRMAREEYGAAPSFTVEQIVVSGILQWRYQAQVPLI